jgi:malonyl-CoA O-methyltransferase
MTTLPIDKARVRRSFERAAGGYDAVAVLQREIADRLLERLDYVRLEPQRVLDLGTGTGHAIGGLQRRYRKAQVIAVDFAHGMLRQARRRGGWWRRPQCVCADAEALPLVDDSVDLIVSNATLQWCDLPLALAECRRVLRPGGLLMFTTFGRDTLIELRQAWSAVDDDAHVSPFLDLHDIGDALVRTRFADPVIDVERLTLTYATVRELMVDLKTLGAHNATLARPRGLTGRARLLALEQAYEIHRCAGRLPASYEVVYGHAWASKISASGRSVAIPISAIGGREHSVKPAP